MTRTALLNDDELTERILGHAANRTTDLGPALWREPVENYRKPERLEAERLLLRRTPIPFCPSAALKEPGAYVSRDAGGVPIVAVRGEDGRVRAFHNVCRHRGMRVAGKQGCAKALVCAYHGWTYGLDGQLRFVPHEKEGFPGLDKAALGLKPVHAVEHGGLVFVTQEGEAAPADLADIPDLIRPGQQLYSSGMRETPANWKVALEGFLEGYHIRTTHPESFLPYGFDNLNVVETFGRHARVVFPFKRIQKLASVPAAERDVTGYVTLVYHLFPNALVIVLSNHTLLLALEPIDIARTNVFAYAMTNATHRDEDPVEAAKRDADFVGNTGAEEDRAMVSAIQHGMSSNANDAFTFGRFEAAIAHLHRNLAAELG
jgi:phenylpropionate dioxygenase-like ring-hydroxylating dioxygenase large terminal subunit